MFGKINNALEQIQLYLYVQVCGFQATSHEVPWGKSQMVRIFSITFLLTLLPIQFLFQV